MYYEWLPEEAVACRNVSLFVSRLRSQLPQVREHEKWGGSPEPLATFATSSEQRG